MNVEISDNAADAYEWLRVDRQRTLTGPEDDMWATLADLAAPHALTRRGQLVGRFSVDDERQLHAFYVTDEFEPMASDLFIRVINELDISAVMASTVDPLLLSLGLAAGGVAQPKALMYDHIAPCESDETVDLRLAGTEDHMAAVAFCQSQTGSSDAFLKPYLAARIEGQELYVLETEGRVVATGECRVDKRSPGNVHLGLIVGAEQRGQGLGSRLMHTLTTLCEEQGMTPRCSTEPTNAAAQKVIRYAGFRTRHRVLRLALTR